MVAPAGSPDARIASTNSSRMAPPSRASDGNGVHAADTSLASARTTFASEMNGTRSDRILEYGIATPLQGNLAGRWQPPALARREQRLSQYISLNPSSVRFRNTGTPRTVLV